MRAVLGVLSLLLVVAIVGFLTKKQVKAVSEIQVPVMSTPAAAGGPALPAINPGGNVQQQSQAIQQQFKEAAEAAVQHARPVPDE